MFNLTFLGACSAGMINDWRSRVIDPAVPMSMVIVPALMFSGAKVISEDPNLQPVTRALHICFNAWIAVRCCAFNPGFGLFARMLLTLNGLLRTVERANAVRIKAPPPSP